MGNWSIEVDGRGNIDVATLKARQTAGTLKYQGQEISCANVRSGDQCRNLLTGETIRSFSIVIQGLGAHGSGSPEDPAVLGKALVDALQERGVLISRSEFFSHGSGDLTDLNPPSENAYSEPIVTPEMEELAAAFAAPEGSPDDSQGS